MFNELVKISAALALSTGISFLSSVADDAPTSRSGNSPGGLNLWNTGYYNQLDALNNKKMPVSAIPWSKYTHVIHANILPKINADGAPGIDSSTYQIDANAAEFTNEAHQAGVKALVALIICTNQVAAMDNNTSPANIDAFVKQLAQFIKSKEYDGIDIDWEEGLAVDRVVNFVTMLRDALPAPQYAITFAASLKSAKYINSVVDKLDQINLMCYDWSGQDYAGQEINRLGFNSALLSGQGMRLGDYANLRSIEEEVYWVSVRRGIPKNKLGILMPFYGFIVKAPRKDSDRGVTGPEQLTRSPVRMWLDKSKILNYTYWAALQKSEYWTKGKKIWDEGRKTPYIAYTGENAAQDAYVTYTNPRQIMEAVKWAKANGIGGMGCYALEEEYLPERNGEDRYQLSTALYKSIISNTAQLDAMIASETKSESDRNTAK